MYELCFFCFEIVLMIGIPQFDRRMFMEDPIPMPQEYRTREMEKMHAMQTKAQNQSRLFAMQQNEDIRLK
jgi:hypothetical protein